MNIKLEISPESDDSAEVRARSAFIYCPDYPDAGWSEVSFYDKDHIEMTEVVFIFDTAEEIERVADLLRLAAILHREAHAKAMQEQLRFANANGEFQEIRPTE